MTTTTTIRVSTKTRNRLHELTQIAGVPMQQIVEQAIELYSRQQALESLNRAYAALHADPSAREELQAELAAWDTTLLDGLEDR